MTPFEQARKIFPGFPEEVFSLWLDECIEKYGWPPVGDEWDRVLVGYPILYCNKLLWTEKEAELSFDRLGPLSRRTVNGIMAANVARQPDPSSANGGDLQKRFDSIFKFMVEKKDLPGKMVLLDEGNYFEILEGCRRMAVICAMRQFPEFRKYVPERFRCWIACLDPKFRKLFGKD